MNVLIGMSVEFGHHFFSTAHLRDRMRRCIRLVLTMEELVKVTNSRNGVEVVFLRRVVGHPLKGATVPRIKRRNRNLLQDVFPDNAFNLCCRYDDYLHGRLEQLSVAKGYLTEQ